MHNIKELISKLKNKKVKGNVSLLIILILLASSVIALLSINQIQHLLTYGNMTFNYFRSYYLAKAWTELWLTEVYYREAWFEDTIESWDNIVTENLIWDYSSFNPYFTMSISWNFKYITNDIRDSDRCYSGNKILLHAAWEVGWKRRDWEWIMLSLFTDNTKGINNILKTESSITPLPNPFIESLNIVGWDWKFTFWIFSFSGDSMEDALVSEWKDLKNFLSTKLKDLKTNDRKYLTIKNSSDKDVSFCIAGSSYEELPNSNSLITVRANYWVVEVWLQSVVEKTTPSWTLNVLWEINN